MFEYGKNSFKNRKFLLNSRFLPLYWYPCSIRFHLRFWYKVFIDFFSPCNVHFDFLDQSKCIVSCMFDTKNANKSKFPVQWQVIIYIPINCVIWAVNGLNQAYCFKCMCKRYLHPTYIWYRTLHAKGRGLTKSMSLAVDPINSMPKVKLVGQKGLPLAFQ